MAEQQSTSDMTRTGFAAMRGAIAAERVDELSPVGRAAFDAGLAAIRDSVPRVDTTDLLNDLSTIDVQIDALRAQRDEAYTALRTILEDLDSLTRQTDITAVWFAIGYARGIAKRVLRHEQAVR